ncbi:hypothetical protein Tco_1476945 [Tanacetum coccineum]
MEVVDWSFLVEDHPKWLSKDVVQLVQACSCSRDHFLPLDAKRDRVIQMIRKELELGARSFSIWHDPEDSLFGEGNHHVIHKIEIIRKCMRMSDANMLKEASKIKGFSNGETVDHVAETSIGMVLVSREAYDVLTKDDFLFLKIDL